MISRLLLVASLVLVFGSAASGNSEKIRIAFVEPYNLNSLDIAGAADLCCDDSGRTIRMWSGIERFYDEVVKRFSQKFSGIYSSDSVPARYNVLVRVKVSGSFDKFYIEGDTLHVKWRSSVQLDFESREGEAWGNISEEAVAEKVIEPPIGRGWTVASARSAVWGVQEEARRKALDQMMAALETSGIAERLNELIGFKVAPCHLELKVRFDESGAQLPNSRLDAGETGELIIDLANQGPGPAYAVRMSFTSENKAVKLPDPILLGEIPPGSTREIRQPIMAPIDLRKGVAEIRIEAKERRGYDATPLRFSLPVDELVQPVLEFSDIKLNDASGRASGDGDGSPANGETLEVIFLVRNRGRGDAGRVSVNAETRTTGVEGLELAQNLGAIPAGQARQGKLLVRLPPSFDQTQLSLKLIVTEGRGEQVARSEVSQTWQVAIRKPDIRIGYKIFDGNSPASSGNRNSMLNNGEAVELELTPSNRGVVAAGSVLLKMAAGVEGLSVNPGEIDLGDLPASSLGVPHRVRLQIPRTFRGDRIPLQLAIGQKDFPERVQEIVLPVEVLTPDLSLDVAGVSGLQQGDRCQITLQIENRGTLEARGVEVEVSSDWQGLDILSSRKDPLGTLGPNAPAAPSHIDLFARPGAKLGMATLMVTVRQADFPPLVRKIEVPITDRPPIEVAAEPPPPRASSAAGIATRPVIFFRNYASGEIVANETVSLAFEVQDGKGISWVTVTQDGRNVPLERIFSEIDKQLGVMVNRYGAALSLKPGKNLVQVTAVNQDGVKSEASLSLTRPAERQQVWAAVIGVSRYEDSSIKPLGFADSDAESFRRYLVNSLGVPESHISMLVNEEATRRGIIRAIGDELRIRAGGNDTVFIYFAGHGANESDRQSNDGSSKYLLPHDTERSSYNSTALSLEELERQLDRIEAGRVVVLLDSCFSGAAGGRTIFEKAIGKRGPLSDDFLRRIAESGRGRVVLTASDINEVAEERGELRKVVFTHFLLEALGGNADRSPFGNGDGLISVDEAYAYTSKKVREATRNQQNPQKFGHISGELLIGKVPERATRP